MPDSQSPEQPPTQKMSRRGLFTLFGKWTGAAALGAVVPTTGPKSPEAVPSSESLAEHTQRAYKEACDSSPVSRALRDATNSELVSLRSGTYKGEDETWIGYMTGEHQVTFPDGQIEDITLTFDTQDKPVLTGVSQNQESFISDRVWADTKPPEQDPYPVPRKVFRCKEEESSWSVMFTGDKSYSQGVVANLARSGYQVDYTGGEYGGSLAIDLSKEPGVNFPIGVFNGHDLTGIRVVHFDNATKSLELKPEVTAPMMNSPRALQE